MTNDPHQLPKELADIGKTLGLLGLAIGGLWLLVLLIEQLT